MKREREASENYGKEVANAKRHRKLLAREREAAGNWLRSDRKETPAMRLVPTQSPGRGTRKARDFAIEIAQLRAQGYTLDAIRIALANAGVDVTISTVWREANRAAAALPTQPVAKAMATSAPAPDAVVPTIAQASASPPAAQTRPERRNGKEVAEAFMRNQITNPLFRDKEQR